MNISVGYVDVVGQGKSSKMVSWHSNGEHARMQVWFIFSKNYQCYAIQRVVIDAQNFAYRKGSKSWVDSVVMLIRLGKSRVAGPSSKGRRRVLFLDCCNVHTITDELKKRSQKMQYNEYFCYVFISI